MKKGFTLIELLVVIGIFAVVMVIVSQSSFTIFQNIRRTDVQMATRNELSDSVQFIERQVRNAKSITNCSGSGSSNPRLDVVDENDQTISYRCNINTRSEVGEIYTIGQDTRSNTGNNVHTRLTSGDIFVTSCEFVCDMGSIGVPPSVDITVKGQSKTDTSDENIDEITLSTRVQLRTY